MTPLTEDSTPTATISLTTQQVSLIKNGFHPGIVFEETVVQQILEKLRKSLALSERLSRPVEKREPKATYEGLLDI